MRPWLIRWVQQRRKLARGDEDVDAKRSRPSIGKPAMGHASKERVLLIGTDQRITSGPAAKRLHSKAGYMVAPERFAERSDSFPLHRGSRCECGRRSTAPSMSVYVRSGLIEHHWTCGGCGRQWSSSTAVPLGSVAIDAAE